MIIVPSGWQAAGSGLTAVGVLLIISDHGWG